MRIIASGTTSGHKSQAITKALAALGLDFGVYGFGAESGVPAQPYGASETRFGAMRRALLALDAVPSAAYGIGIENGIIQADNVYMDVAFVAIANRSAMVTTYATSLGIPCPEKYVRASAASGFTKTAGAFFAEAVGCDPTDWHSHVTNGRLSRAAILEQAVIAALSTAGLV